MATHQDIYDAIIPIVAELIKTGVLDSISLASTIEQFAAVGEQTGKDPTLLLTLASQIRRGVD